MLSEEEIRVDFVANDKQLIDSLDNVAKQVTKMSRTVNTALENVADSLAQVADAAKNMGSGVAQGAKQGAEELKKLDKQAKETSKNLSSSTTSASTPLTRFGPAKLQQVDSSRQLSDAGTRGNERILQAEKEITAEKEKQRRLEEETAERQRTFLEQKRRETAEVEAVAKLDAQRQKALQERNKLQEGAVRDQQRLAQAQAQEIKQLAIARTLRIGTNQVMADGSKRFVADISRVTPAIQQAIGALPRLRYALFDAARGFAVISAASAALAIAPAALAISYRREFADVERTTGLAGAELERLRQDFIKLKQDIPISWEEITDIGTLAGQLGISGNLIADFSASVARFAATTDLNVEQTATLFGRLNQLIDGVDGQFEKLSSSINKVGVISVATESEIGAIAQNIAAIANQAGFAASEVIGLAGALASLGVRPELARGTITRLFSNINRSIAASGRSVREYGRLTNQTAEEFAQAWSGDPSTVLIEIFRGIDEEGGRAERTLRDLGITSNRDVPTILRLAQNYGLVAELVAEAGIAFDEGNESQKQYAAITSTVSEQLKLLGQNLGLLTATIGDGANALSGLVAIANDVVRALIRINNNPAASTFFLVTGAILLTISAFAGLAAILAISIAKTAGIITSLVDLNTVMIGTAKSTGSMTLALKAYTVEALRAIVGTKRLRAAILGFKVFAVIAGLVAVASFAYGVWNRATRDSIDIAREAFGEISSFTEAVKADTAAHLDGADAIIVRRKEIEKDEKAAEDASKAIRNFAKSQEDAEKAVAALTGELKEQIIAFDEASISAAIDLALTEDTDVNKLLNQIFDLESQTGLMEEFGITFRDIVIAGLSGEEAGAQFMQDFVSAVGAEEAALQRELERIDAAILAGTSSPEDEQRYDVVLERLRLIKEELGVVFPEFAGLISQTIRRFTDLGNAGSEAFEKERFAKGIRDTGDAAELTGEQIQDLIENIFGAENRARDTQNSIVDLGEAFAEMGEEALGSSEVLQNAIAAILTEFSGDPDQAVRELIGLFVSLADVGVNVASPAMELLRDQIFRVGEESTLAEEKITAMLNGLAPVAAFTDFGANLEKGFQRVGKSASGAAGRVKSFDDQMKELLDTLFEFDNKSQAASNAIFALGEAFGEIGDEAFFAGSEMQSAINSIVAASSNGEEAVANLSALLGTLSSQSGVSGASLQVLRQVIEEVGSSAGLSAQRIAQLVQSAGSGLSTVALNNFSRGLQSVNKEVRTLLDYASDLNQVFSRAFDIRFKAVLNMDSITASWEDLNNQVDEVTQSLSTLSADRSVKEYFLSVAEAYGDTLRADVIRAELADIEKEIADAQASLSREVVGDSRAARENRATITGLVGQYQEYIASLAESGATQEELREAVVKARREFEEQARQLGFSEATIRQYGAAFDDVTLAIERVPRNITVDANVNPALQALNELNANLNRNIEAARTLNTELGKPPPPRPSPTQVEIQPVVPEPVIIPFMPGYVPPRRGIIETFLGQARQQQLSFSTEPSILFAGGGFTGRGGKFDPAGIVHRGEYVIPKQFVNQSTGMPDPSFLAQMQSGMRNYFAGGFVGGSSAGNDGTMMVELSPYDRKLLADAGNVQLRLNGRVVAEATNQNNFEQARRGSD